MNKLINALDSKKIIYLFPKSGGQNVINANTQRDLSTIPVNDYEIKKLFYNNRAMVHIFNSKLIIVILE